MKKVAFVMLLTSALSAQAQENLPANPWADYSPTQEIKDLYASQETLGVKRPKFQGERLMINPSTGQPEMVPEVNITNMLLITDYLRKIGYKIPKKWDKLIQDAPSDLQNKIFNALHTLSNGNSNDPVKKGFSAIRKHFEKFTGLDFENLVSTSADIMDAK